MSKSWYVLHTYTGYENKIEREIRQLLETEKLDSNIVTNVKVPVEELVEIKDGKKKSRKNKFLPGYIMLELDLPQIDWKNTCNTIRRINGVTGFVGTAPNVRPRPISNDEALNLLQKSGDVKGEKMVTVKHSYSVGDQIKITEGPFATFTGEIDEVMADKNKLKVTVQIFGRATPVEVDMTQAEKIV